MDFSRTIHSKQPTTSQVTCQTEISSYSTQNTQPKADSPLSVDEIVQAQRVGGGGRETVAHLMNPAEFFKACQSGVAIHERTSFGA